MSPVAVVIWEAMSKAREQRRGKKRLGRGEGEAGPWELFLTQTGGSCVSWEQSSQEEIGTRKRNRDQGLGCTKEGKAKLWDFSGIPSPRLHSCACLSLPPAQSTLL